MDIRRLIGRPGRAVLLIAVGAAGTGAAIAVAAGGSSGVIHACVNLGQSGTLPAAGPNLQVIDPGASQTCNTSPNPGSAGQEALSWNITGQPGATGAAGPTGPSGAADVITISGLTPPATGTPIGGMKLFGPNGQTIHFKFLSFELDQSSSSSSSATDVASRNPTGQRIHRPFVIVREVDKASPILFQNAVAGVHYKTVTLVCRKAGGTQNEYLVFGMTNVAIASDQVSAAGGGTELERVSFTFQKITVKDVTSNTPPDDWLGF